MNIFKRLLLIFKSNNKSNGIPKNAMRENTENDTSLNIQFTGRTALVEGGGISFQAIVNERNVSCYVTIEYIQDNFGIRMVDDSDSFYNQYKMELDSLVEEKIKKSPSEYKFYIY